MNEAAEKLLFALYAETCGKKPQLSAAARSLGLDDETFGRAVNLLYISRLVGGVIVKFGDNDDKPIDVAADDLLLTRRGAAYVENALGLGGDAAAVEKLSKVLARSGEPGWEAVRAVAEKAIADYLEKV